MHHAPAVFLSLLNFMNRLRFRQLLAIVALSVIMPALAHGQTEAADAWDPYLGEVFVSPLIYVGVEDVELAYEIRESVRAGAEEYIRNMPGYFGVVELEDLQRQIKSRPTYEDSVGIGKNWTELGVESYKRLETAEAIKALEKAVKMYRGIYYEFISPREFADVLQYLSLSYLEQRSSLARTLDLLQLMMTLDPARVFRAGYYPEDVVRAYQDARETLERRLRDNGPDVVIARKLAELTGAEYVVVPSVVSASGASGEYELIFFVYSASQSNYMPGESLELDVLTASSAREASNRLISRFATCLVEPQPSSKGPVSESSGESPWSVELNFAYASFLEFPGTAVELFGNYGASFGAAYLLTQEFAFLSNLQFLTSLRDFSGFIPDGFTTLRGFAGIGLGYTFGPVRPEVASLLEVSRIGDVAVCDNINVVLDGCPIDRTVYEIDTLVGINIRPRVKLQVLKSLVYAVGGSATFYVFPFSGRSVNFPLTFETGLEYRF